MIKEIERRSISNLLNCSKKYAIPFFQRDYVWEKQNVTGFLDSLFRRWPTGAIIIWDTKEPGRSFGSMQERPKILDTPSGLILDGQQRLTTLILLKERGNLELKGDYGHKEKYYFYFDLDGKDEKKFVAITEQSNLTNFIDVQKILNGNLRKKDCDKKNWRVINQIKKIPKYVFPVIHVATKKNENAIKIFDRVNTSGKKIDKVDIAFAILKDKEHALAEKIVDAQEDWLTQGFDLSNRVLINSFIIRNNITDEKWYVTTRKPDDQIKNYLEESPQINKDWDTTAKRIGDALKFLREDCGFDSAQFLSSENTIAGLVGYFEKQDIRRRDLLKKQKNRLRKWLYRTIVTGRYSLTTNFQKDLEHVQDNAVFKVHKLKKAPESEYTPEGCISMMYALGKRNGMKDYSGTPIIWTDTKGKARKIQVDHIYPRARLTKPPICTVLEEELVNDIGNKAFITGELNPSKNKKFPGERVNDKNIGQWLEGSHNFLKDEDYLKMKNSKKILRENCYEIKKFIISRRKKIISQINKEIC